MATSMSDPQLTTRESEKNIFDESMEIFQAAADLIGLAPRIRLELEQPDYEHIFYVTSHVDDRLVPVPDADARTLGDLQMSSPDRAGLLPLADGKLILRPEALRSGALHVRDRLVRLEGTRGSTGSSQGASCGSRGTGCSTTRRAGRTRAGSGSTRR